MSAVGAASTPGLHWMRGSGWRDFVEIAGIVGEGSTWPPEKPTATTPSSLPFERNFWWTVEGAVMVNRNGGRVSSQGCTS